MNPTNLIDFLKNRLIVELPGFESHKKMFPTQKGLPFRKVEPPADARKSAVLVLLVHNSSTDRLSILFTLRSTKLKKHSGQISFPGGKCDKGETFLEAALRETWEEVGIPSEKINILGKLSQIFVPPSNSVIQPVLGYTNEKLQLKLSEDEVEEAFFIELGTLLLPTTKKNTLRNLGGTVEANVPYYDVHTEVPLWGATAIILSELLDLIIEMQ